MVELFPLASCPWVELVGAGEVVVPVGVSLEDEPAEELPEDGGTEGGTPWLPPPCEPVLVGGVVTPPLAPPEDEPAEEPPEVVGGVCPWPSPSLQSEPELAEGEPEVVLGGVSEESSCSPLGGVVVG
jgi:hypothetical protein